MSALRGDLDTLFLSIDGIEEAIESLSWADVLENGTTPGVDVNFFGYDATGLGEVTTTGTFTGDSLVLNKDAAIAGRLNVTSVTSLGDSLSVLGVVDFADSLRVVKSVSVGQRLFVTGITSLGDSLHVVGNVDVDALFNVDGAATFGATVEVSGVATLRDTLHVDGATLLNDSLNVDGNTYLEQDLQVDGNTNIGGRVNINGAVNLGDSLHVSGVTSLGDSLHVAAGVDIDGDLNVDGNTTLNSTTVDGDLDLNGNADISGSLDVAGATTLSDSLVVEGQTILNDSLHVNAPALLQDSLHVGGGASFGSTVNISGSTTLSSHLTVGGNSSLGGTLSVTGVTSLNDSLHVSGGVDFDGNLNVDGNTSLNNLTAIGATTINGEMTTNAEVTFNDTAHFSKPALFADSAGFAGNVDVGGTLEVSQLVIDGVTIPALDDTDALPEGDTNLYFTAAREAALQAQIDYSDSINSVLQATIDNLLSQLFDPASILTQAAENVLVTTADLVATIDNGGAVVEEAGFVLSTQSDLSDSTQYVVTTDGVNLAQALSSLTKGTTYYFRPFARTIMGRQVGTISNFTTIDDPQVSTLTTTDAGQTTATLSGTLTSDGGGTISASGFRYATNALFTGAITVSGSQTSGTFTASLTGLSQNTTYYFQAFVTNEAGTAYGTSKTLTTVGPCNNTFLITYQGVNYELEEYGDDCWFVDNLRATSFQDGTAISEYTQVDDDNNVVFWSAPYYLNMYYDDSNEVNGLLYNKLVAYSGDICPSGWHVPSDGEWKGLEMHLGMSESEANAGNRWRGTNEGQQMKSKPSDSPSWDGTNTSGFNLILGATFHGNSQPPFGEGINRGRYHTSSMNGNDMIMRFFQTGKNQVFRQTDSSIGYGGYIRCVRD